MTGAPPRRRRVGFYAPVPQREVLDRVEFYRQDLDALRAMDADLVIATRWNEIPWNADVYVIWWWTWAFVPLLVAWWRGRPAIVTGVFDYQWPEPGLDYVNRPAWQRWLMRTALRAAAANVFVADFEYRQVTAALDVTRASCVPLGVDTGRYRPADAPRERFVLTIGWLGTQNARRKCIHEVVRAAALVGQRRPDVRFVIAGVHGDAFPDLSRLARELGVAERIDWPGRVSDVEKVRLLQTCAVYLQPTVYEGFGLAILEALSCGAPVVSSPVGAVNEVVGDTAVLVDGRSPERIAEAVVGLLDDPAGADARGRAGRARAVANFAVERRQQGLIEVIEAVTAAHARPR